MRLRNCLGTLLVLALILSLCTPCLAVVPSLPSISLTVRPLTEEEAPSTSDGHQLYGLFVQVDGGVDDTDQRRDLRQLSLNIRISNDILPYDLQTGTAVETSAVSADCVHWFGADSTTVSHVDSVAMGDGSVSILFSYWLQTGLLPQNQDLFALYFQVRDDNPEYLYADPFQWEWDADALNQLNGSAVCLLDSSWSAYIYGGTGGTVLPEENVILRDLEPSVASEIRLFRNGEALGNTDTVRKPVGTEDARSYTYTATVYDQYGIAMDDAVSWTGSDTDGFSMTSDGVLTVTPEAPANGTVTLTASAGSASRSVTVTAAELAVDWSGVEAAIQKGLTYGETLSDLNLPETGTASLGEEPLHAAFSYTPEEGPWAVGSHNVDAACTVQIPGETDPLVLHKSFAVAVEKKAVTVQADDIRLTYGQGLPELTFTVPDGALVNGDGPEDLHVQLAAEGAEPRLPGTYNITGTASAANYDVTVETGTLTVTKDAVTVTDSEGNPLTPLSVRAWQVQEATNLADLGLPSQVTVTGKNGETATVPAIWDKGLEDLKAAASQGLTELTLTLTNATYPAWAEAPATPYTVTVSILGKELLPGSAITFADTVTTYGQTYTPAVPVLGESYRYGELHYTYTYGESSEKPTQAGKYTVTVTVENDRYYGTATADLIIQQKKLTEAMVTMEPGPFVYSGQEIQPKCTVQDLVGQQNWITSSDYEVSYRNNTDAGDAQDKQPPCLVVSALRDGNYTSTVTIPFTISPAALDSKTPVLSGDGTVGSVLEASLPGVAEDQYTWHWYRDGEECAVGSAVYTVTSADSGRSITVRAEALGLNYTGSSATSQPVVVAKQQISGTVTVAEAQNVAGGTAGYLEVGDTLEATAHLTPAVAVTYQWYLNGAPVTGAVGKTFVIPSGSADKTVAVSVTPADPNFHGTVTSNPVDVNRTMLSGTITLTRNGDTVTAALSGNLTDASCTLVWARNGREIAGASGRTYTLTAQDLGTELTARAVARGDYTGAVVSDPLSIPASVPQAPAVSVTAGNGQASVVWTPPASSGAPITGYRLTVTANGTVILTKDFPVGTTQFTVTELVNGVQYTFTVTAINLAGSSVGGIAIATPVFPGGGSGGGSGGGGTTPVQPEPEPIPVFDDVDADGWAAPYIYDLCAYGIVQGVGNNCFAPTRPVTRAEFVKLLAGVADADVSTYNDTPFSDVDADAWYAPYVAWAAENGIVSGVSATAFSPDAPISREQMAAMLYRLIGVLQVELPAVEAPADFTDADAIYQWATEAISALQQAGLLDGVSGGRFAPDGLATREQACKVLSLLLDLVEA